MNENAPDGWRSTTLAKVASTQLGKTINPKERGGPNQKPYLRNANVQWDRVDVEDILTMEFSDAEAERFNLKPGDLLTCEGGNVGRSAIWKGDIAGCCFQNAIHRIRPLDEEVSAEWLLENMRYLSESGVLATRAQGNTIQHLSQQELRKLPVVFPTREEQDAIVSVLSRTRSFRLSTSSHLQAARLATARFRQAVLAAACSGRLTADWREMHGEVKSAHELLASITQDRRMRLGRRFKEAVAPELEASIPDTWVWTTAGALVDVATGATPLRKRSDYYDGTIPWVTSGAVNAGLITEAKEFISELAVKETNAKVFPSGTLLVAMYGEGQTRGRVAELGIHAATNQAVAALLFDDVNERLRPYVRVFFLENYERIRQLSFGGVQPNLNLGVIRDTVLPLPPQEEQDEIVRRIAQLTIVINEVEDRISAASRAVELTSRALLSKAFRGGLITTEG